MMSAELGSPDAEGVGVHEVEVEVKGGARDGAAFRGLQLDNPPAAVLIVAHDGRPMMLSPMGYGQADTLGILAQALAALTASHTAVKGL
jgi:hypothetical protein